MKKIIILAIVILFTACSAEAEESALNSFTTISSVEGVMTSSTEITTESSSTEPSISEATTKIDIQHWEFNMDELSDRLTDIALIDQSRGFIPPAQYSLFDLDFDGVPELVFSYHSSKANSFNEIYDVCTREQICSIFTAKKIVNDVLTERFSGIFNGVYYIDHNFNTTYFIESYLDGWGADGFTNRYTKYILYNSNLNEEDTIGFPISKDGLPLYNPEEPINLFAPEDECRELYIKSVLVEYIYDETESELRGRIKTAMERLVDDYYSGLENSNKE